MSERIQFSPAFYALNDYEPFAWQERLYSRMVASDFPRTCDIPTGLGKTAVIPIWLIALAADASLVPRRLIYIVNRRTVVDQATDIARTLRQRLSLPHDVPEDTLKTLRTLQQAIQRLAAYASNEVVAISTLRGELADNEEWKKDPARPAIIIGTIDMVGSKLLFSGYGDRRYGRAHHAGLIGQDTLIVHDEAHLTPALGDLLRAVAREQQKLEKERAVRVMELSATGRTENEESITLESADERGESASARILRERLDAEKHLTLHPTDSKAVSNKLVELAVNHEAAKAKVLIYVTKPEDAKGVANMLRQRYGDRVALLTGTLRGYERDGLVETRVFKALLDSQQPATETLYLVSTSAGEVGVDFDADHMVCDFTTLDSMIQRLGRVNRRGGRSARVDVVIATETEKSEGDGTKIAALRATRAALERLPKNADGDYNASPRAVTELLRVLTEEEKDAAFQQHPPAIAATDIFFDAWSLTSIHEKLPGRPEVAAFLHGITNDPPETYVAWRHEVTLLSAPSVSIAAVRDWFRACRLKSHELLRDNTERAFQHLTKIRDRAPNTPIILLNERGEVERLSLDALLKKKDAKPVLAFRTVVLPIGAGGLSESGMLDGTDRKEASDVAEQQRRDPQQSEHKRTRVHLRVLEGEFWTRMLDRAEGSLGPASEAGSGCTSPRDAAKTIAREHKMKISQMIALREPTDSAEGETAEYLVLLVEGAEIDVENSEGAPQDDPPTIEEHTRDVLSRVIQISDALQLDKSLKNALILAAELHDSGKGRVIWQRAIFNDSETMGNLLAKPGVKGMDWRRLGGYRHEFGSLLDASQHERVKNRSDEERDLVLHLIAAHHGHARPHFEAESHNFEKNSTEENDDAASETMRRFGRLQLRFGRWQLAWLESLLRCADAAASAEPSPRAGVAA